MNILIAGGGTGGHLFPGIAIAEEFKKRSSKNSILFVGSQKGIETRQVPKSGFDLEVLPIVGFSKLGIIGFMKSMFSIPLSLWKSFFIIQKFKPDISIGLGGYAAGPTILVARLLNIPCAILEQNSIPGFTNRILSKIVNSIFSSLPVSEFPSSKTYILGNPIRSELLNIRHKPFKPELPLKLLVIGGSSGAKTLNDIITKISTQLNKRDISITHQTGILDFNRLKEFYSKQKIYFINPIAFIDNMSDAYEHADLILARAGATTIAELTLCGRPSILIPFPYATNDHQSKNAEILVQKGATIHIPEQNLNVSKLLSILKDFIENKNKLINMAKAAHKLGKPDASENIVDKLISMVKEKKRSCDV